MRRIILPLIVFVCQFFLLGYVEGQVVIISQPIAPAATCSGIGTQTLTVGIVNLPDLGWYNYNIYQQSSSTNLIVSAATSIVETGLAFVSASTANNKVTFKTDSPITNNYF